MWGGGEEGAGAPPRKSLDTWRTPTSASHSNGGRSRQICQGTRARAAHAKLTTRCGNMSLAGEALLFKLFAGCVLRRLQRLGVFSKSSNWGYAGFSLPVHLPVFHFGPPFASHPGSRLKHRYWMSRAASLAVCQKGFDVALF